MKKLSQIFLLLIFALLSYSVRAADAVEPPANDEVCFSPDEPCGPKLTSFIHSAEQSLDIAIYSINLPPLVDEILQKALKIPVRIIVDNVQAHGPTSLVCRLIANQAIQGMHIKVRIGKQQGRGIMHDKFSIVDGDRIETGSFNYTNNASSNNQENQVYLGTPDIVKRYIERFNTMWDERSTPPFSCK